MVSSRMVAAITAGLVAGLVFGAIMQLIVVPAPDGGRMPMIAMVGQFVGSPTIVAGWLCHLVNSAVIGAIFGWLFGDRSFDYRHALGWGAAYGFAWWIVGGLILMPVLLGMAAFAPLTVPDMRVMAFGSLIGHLAFGAMLGEAFVALQHRARVRPA